MTSTAGQQDAAVGDVVDPVVSPKDTPILNDDNKFKLVLLSLNTGRGTTLSHGAGTLRITWDETVRIAQAAERAGIDAILPIAHWKNWTRSRPQYDRNWDALTFAAGLAAVTERIQFFSTVHIPLFHPVMVAKMAATVDHIASGRLALNVVAGWNQAEFGMFGLDPVEHDERYEYAAEWMDLLQRIFREDAWFDFEGRYLRGRDIASQPKPLQRPSPVIMSAAPARSGWPSRPGTPTSTSVSIPTSTTSRRRCGGIARSRPRRAIPGSSSAATPTSCARTRRRRRGGATSTCWTTSSTGRRPRP